MTENKGVDKHVPCTIYLTKSYKLKLTSKINLMLLIKFKFNSYHKNTIMIKSPCNG